MQQQHRTFITQRMAQPEAAGESSVNANWAEVAPASGEMGVNQAWDSDPEGPYFLLTFPTREGAAWLAHVSKSVQVSNEELGYTSTSCRHIQLCQWEQCPNLCSTWMLVFLGCVWLVWAVQTVPVILPYRILILVKPQKSMILFSQPSLGHTTRSHRKQNSLIAKKFNWLCTCSKPTCFNSALKQVCYMATDYQLSKEMSEQAAHSNFIITFKCIWHLI